MNPTALNRPLCPVCGASSSDHVRSADGGHWLRCPDCGLLWSPDALLEWPNLLIAQHGGVLPDGYAFNPAEPKIASAGTPMVVQGQADRLSHVEKQAPKRGLFLEIGFGSGDMMVLAHKSGWRGVWGIEAGADFVVFARSRGLTAHYASIEAGVHPLPGISLCDAVVLSEVMEHLADPVIALRNAATYLLAPTGILWASFATPGDGRTELNNGEWSYWSRTATRLAIERAGLIATDVEQGCGVLLVTCRRP